MRNAKRAKRLRDGWLPLFVLLIIFGGLVFILDSLLYEKLLISGHYESSNELLERISSDGSKQITLIITQQRLLALRDRAVSPEEHVRISLKLAKHMEAMAQDTERIEILRKIVLQHGDHKLSSEAYRLLVKELPALDVTMVDLVLKGMEQQARRERVPSRRCIGLLRTIEVALRANRIKMARRLLEELSASERPLQKVFVLLGRIYTKSDDKEGFARMVKRRKEVSKLQATDRIYESRRGGISKDIASANGKSLEILYRSRLDSLPSAEYRVRFAAAWGQALYEQMRDEEALFAYKEMVQIQALNLDSHGLLLDRNTALRDLVRAFTICRRAEHINILQTISKLVDKTLPEHEYRAYLASELWALKGRKEPCPLRQYFVRRIPADRIKIDGRDDELEWNQTKPLDKPWRYSLAKDSKTKRNHMLEKAYTPTAKIMHDGIALFIFVFAPEDRMDLLRYGTEKAGSGIYKRDAMEFMLMPERDLRLYYQIDFNVTGDTMRWPKWDYWTPNPLKPATKEKCSQAAGQRRKGGWTVEIRIPLHDIGIAGNPKGLLVRANLWRSRYLSGERQIFSWHMGSGGDQNPQDFMFFLLE